VTRNVAAGIIEKRNQGCPAISLHLAEQVVVESDCTGTATDKSVKNWAECCKEESGTALLSN